MELLKLGEATGEALARKRAEGRKYYTLGDVKAFSGDVQKTSKMAIILATAAGVIVHALTEDGGESPEDESFEGKSEKEKDRRKRQRAEHKAKRESGEYAQEQRNAGRRKEGKKRKVREGIEDALEQKQDLEIEEDNYHKGKRQRPIDSSGKTDRDLKHNLNREK